ncbi:MAG: DNRLRE domain-containing protein, partial [Planctomycetes bacterium]|nr:DNRLRE domain-containing protein [Planctomycetota bacterium]
MASGTTGRRLNAWLVLLAAGGYDAEILCDFDMSVLPEGVTINSVDFEYNVSSANGGPHPVKLYENTRAWSGTPSYNEFGTTPWPGSDLIVEETASGNGWHNFTGNANMENLIEGWLANPSSNLGVILTDAPNYWGWEIQVSGVRLLIDFTPVVTDYNLNLTIGNNGSVEVSAPGFPATIYNT